MRLVIFPQVILLDWAWDFDNDGVVDSSEKNPSYIYQTTGKYTVSLKVTGPGGSDTKIKSEYIRVQGFQLTEWKLLGEGGYAILYCKFNTIGGITLRLTNPVGTLVDVESVTEDVIGGAARLNMDNWWETPGAGQYILIARDALGENVFEKTFSFNGTDVTMSDLAMTWSPFIENEFWPDELFFKAINNGDLPACIYNYEITVDGHSATHTIKQILLPGEQKDISPDYIPPFKVTGSGEKTVSCTLLDKAGVIIAIYSGTLTVA